MMKQRWYMRWGNWGFNLVLLNILWIFFSLAGLIVLTLFPATAALFAVLRSLLIEDEDLSIIKEFIKHFKTEFAKSNIIGYLVTALGVILFVDFKIVQQLNNETMEIIMVNVIFIVGIFYFICMLYIFPLFVHFKLKTWQYIKNAFFLTIARPFHTIMMITFLGITFYLYMLMPVLILLFGMSLLSFITMKVATIAFPKQNIIHES